MIATTPAPTAPLPATSATVSESVPTHAKPTKPLTQSLAVFAITALAAAIGCAAPPAGYHGGPLANIFGLNCGCERADCRCGNHCSCGDSIEHNGGHCTGDCCGGADSGPCCNHEGCADGQCCALAGCPSIERLKHLPCESVACATSCCSPHACPGPPDVPPPGRFHPVPTRPVFSPRFVPTPYGQAEF